MYKSRVAEKRGVARKNKSEALTTACLLTRGRQREEGRVAIMKGPALLPVLQHDAKAQREQVLNHLRGYKGVGVCVRARALSCFTTIPSTLLHR